MTVYLSYKSAVKLYTHLDEFCTLLFFNYKKDSHYPRIIRILHVLSLNVLILKITE